SALRPHNSFKAGEATEHPAYFVEKAREHDGVTMAENQVRVLRSDSLRAPTPTPTPTSTGTSCGGPLPLVLWLSRSLLLLLLLLLLGPRLGVELRLGLAGIPIACRRSSPGVATRHV